MDFVAFFNSPLLRVLLIPAGLLFLVILRRGSTYLLWSRFWKLLTRNQKFNDGALQKFNQEQSDLQQLRFTYGIQADSLEQARRTVALIKLHEIPLEKARRAFADNWTLYRIEKGTSSRRKNIFLLSFLSGCLAISFLLTLFFTHLFDHHAALLSIKSSSTYFWANNEGYQAFWSSEKWEWDNCRNTEKNSALNRFSAADHKIICQLPEEKKFLKTSLESVPIFRGLVAFAALLFLYSCVMLWQMLLNEINAQSVIAQILSNPKPPESKPKKPGSRKGTRKKAAVADAASPVADADAGSNAPTAAAAGTVSEHKD